MFRVVPESDLLHLVTRRKGRTSTMNIGMKARMRSMTTMRATRAMRRAMGKRRQETTAPQ